MKHTDIKTVFAKLSKEQKYPVLVWSELDKVSTIYLAAAAEKIKVVNTFNDHNLSSLFLKLQDTAQIESFIATQALGDPDTYPFELIQLTDNLNWEKLIKEYTLAVEKDQSQPEFDIKLNEAINLYYKADISAAAVDAIYNAIILYMITTAQELGLQEIAFVGDITYQERFALLLHRNLPEEMSARFSDI